MRLISLAAFLLSTSALAGPLTLDGVDIEYRRFEGTPRHPLFLPGDTPKEALNLGVDISLLGVIGWSNQVQSMTDQHQFAMVGWRYRIYLRITDQISVGRYHQSQHLLDRAPASGFPLEDGWYLRLDLIKRQPAGGVF